MIEQALELWTQLLDRLNDLGASLGATYSWWAVLQGGLVILCLAIAYLAGKWLEPRLEAELRKIRNAPAFLRFLALLLRRVKPILFVISLWIAVGVLRAITWPSRSYLLLIVASIVSAWLAISIVTRIIRNRFIANIVAFTLWILATLNILGILPETFALLDSVAIDVQDTSLSVLLALKGIAILSLLIWGAGVIGQFLENRIQKSPDLTPSLKVLITKLSKLLLIAAAVLAGLSAVGIDLTAFAVFSGAVGLGVGFGLQKVVSNLVSGIILLLDKSVKPGDVISVGDGDAETFGAINSMGARYVSVIARDGREYLIPNEDLITNRVLNWSYSNELVRLDLSFGTSYENDPHQVRELAKEVAAAHSRVVADPKPVCHITEFGDSSVNYLLRFWIRDPAKGVTNIRGDIFLGLWDSFKDHGIAIPYPHREVILRGELPLKSEKPD